MQKQRHFALLSMTEEPGQLQCHCFSSGSKYSLFSHCYAKLAQIKKYYIIKSLKFAHQKV